MQRFLTSEKCHMSRLLRYFVSVTLPQSGRGHLQRRHAQRKPWSSTAASSPRTSSTPTTSIDSGGTNAHNTFVHCALPESFVVSAMSESPSFSDTMVKTSNWIPRCRPYLFSSFDSSGVPLPPPVPQSRFVQSLFLAAAF